MLDLSLAGSFFAAALGLVTFVARVAFTLAEERMLPSALAETHPRFKTPRLALRVLAIMVFALPSLALLLTDQPGAAS